MPLPGPTIIRVLAADQDRDWSNYIVDILSGLDEAVLPDNTPEYTRPRPPIAVVVIWGKHATASATLHRELNSWDRERIPIHLIDCGEIDVLDYLNDIASSTHTSSRHEKHDIEWLRTTVLGIDGARSYGEATDQSLHSFELAARNYLAAVVRQLSFIKPIGSNQPHLFDEVYIPVDVTTVDVDQSARSVAGIVGLVRDAVGSRVLLVGPPGGGKSTMLDATAKALAEGGHARATGELPFSIKATDLVASGYETVSDYLRIVTKAAIGSGGRELADKLLDSEEFGTSQTFVLIDGADELTPEGRQSLRRLLRAFETEFPRANIVVSCRTVAADPVLWSGYERAEIRLLTHTEIFAYVCRFSVSPHTERINDVLKRSERLLDLARIPFMLSLIVSAYDKVEDNTDSRTALIQRCIRTLTSRRRPVQALGLSIDELLQCVAAASERLFRIDSQQISSDEDFIYAIHEFIADSRIAGSVMAALSKQSALEAARAIFDSLLADSGLLQRFGRHIEFTHRTFWEYFVGVSLAQRPLAEIGALAGMAHWEEPIRLMAPMKTHGDRDQLLLVLAETNPSLALRCTLEVGSDAVVVKAVVDRASPSALADMVRTLAGSLAVSWKDKDQQETQVLETLSVLLPHTADCEVLYEGLVALRELPGRRAEAQALARRVLDPDGMERRLLNLLKSGGLYAFVEVPHGLFDMGNDSIGRSADEGPVHRVEVLEFAVSSSTLTNHGRDQIPFTVGTIDQRAPTAAHPVIGVTWYEAFMAAAWFGCRLPSEAEWEYACRAGGLDDEVLFNEACLPTYAWCAENSGNATHPVGVLLPNSWGLYDMLGNVREWCGDWFSASYYSDLGGKVSVDPNGPITGVQRVLRGGCFDWNTANLVPSYRNSNLPNNRGFQNSVRFVRGVPNELSWIIE